MKNRMDGLVQATYSKRIGQLAGIVENQIKDSGVIFQQTLFM